MQDYIICRVCGYIEKAENGDKPCPACGFPKTVWTEYKARRLKPMRKRILDAHVHPIFVHFPIVFTVLVMVLPFLAFFTPYPHSVVLYNITTLTCYILPVLALVGALSGVASGKLRYNSYKASLLVKKMILSVAYFLFTLGLAGIAYAQGVQSTNALWVMILAAFASGCAAQLGRMGSHLFATILGPFVADRP